jgi:hypothetical protein
MTAQILISKRKIEFQPEQYKDLSDKDKERKIYENAITLPEKLNYRKIALTITFDNTSNIPDTIQVYCFNGMIVSSFQFPVHNVLSPYKIHKPNRLTIDIDKHFEDGEFLRNAGQFIDRIGFCIDNITDGVKFTCQTFMKN